MAAEEGDCVICLEPRAGDSPCARCAARFHAACLEQYRERFDTCPACRAPLPSRGPPANRAATALAYAVVYMDLLFVGYFLAQSARASRSNTESITYWVLCTLYLYVDVVIALLSGKWYVSRRQRFVSRYKTYLGTECFLLQKAAFDAIACIALVSIGMVDNWPMLLCLYRLFFIVVASIMTGYYQGGELAQIAAATAAAAAAAAAAQAAASVNADQLLDGGEPAAPGTVVVDLPSAQTA